MIKTDPLFPVPLALEVDFASSKWEALEPSLMEKMELAFDHIIREHDYDFPLEVSVTFTDDPSIQELNHIYRHQNKPTNVLSFPQNNITNGVFSKKVFPLLGDIVIAFETTDQEAHAQNKLFIDHVTHLLVHGFLHLLGYDHERPEDALIMEPLEIKILAKMGISNPYEDTKE